MEPLTLQQLIQKYPEVRATRIVVRLTLGILYFVFASTTTFLFWLRARHDIDLSKRSTSLTVLGGASNVLVGTVSLIGGGFWGEFPCVLHFLAVNLGLLPLLYSLIARSIRLILYWRLNQIKSREWGISEKKVRDSCLDNLVPTRESTIDRYIWRTFWVIIALDIAYIVVLEAVTKTKPGVESIGVYPAISYICPVFRGYWFVTVLFVIYVVVTPLTVFLSWQMRDNYGIRMDLVMSTLIGIPMFTIYFLWDLTPVYWRFCLDNFTWIFFAFFTVQISSVVIPVIKSILRARRPSEQLDWSDFEAMLIDRNEFEAFKRHSIKEFSAEHTRFIEEYQTLRIMTIEGYKPLINLSDTELSPSLPNPEIMSPSIPIARSITGFSTLPPQTKLPESLHPTYVSFFNLFLREEAVLEVSVTGRVKEEVRRRMNEPESIDIMIFDAAMKEVLNLLFYDVFPRFVANRKVIKEKYRFKRARRLEVEDGISMEALNMSIS